MYREELILEHVGDKKVLDCGGADHYAFQEKLASKEWLHDKIAGRAKECIGVDILKQRVDEINKQGRYRFIEANVEKLPFQEEFDVVVAGEIVEHVYNCGLFLDSAWRALKQNGKLIITTPNAYSLTGIIYSIFRRKERCHPEHVCYYSPQTLRYLVERHGFSIDELHCMSRPSQSRLIEIMRALVIRWNPLLGEKIVVIASKTPEKKLYTGSW